MPVGKHPFTKTKRCIVSTIVLQHIYLKVD